ncbi:Imm58 family immunity protein [Caballeronia sp. LZ032]|uniref:Imm58 family immunity protein n=1 Tax=Caballeronia sp. LZ032 TaxID=3038565 RepID=UPI0038D3979D
MNTTSRCRFAAALLVLCCLALVYRVFDQGITRTYLEASEEASHQQVKLLTALITHEWLGLPEDEVLFRLNPYVTSRPPGSVVLKTEPATHHVYLDSVRFEFDNGKLISVE